MWTTGQVAIGRLRVQRGAEADADPAQAAARAFGMLDLEPASLPRGATLCVRHLRDPAPGGLALRIRDAREAAGWRASVERALRDLARDAALPADGPVPAGAAAVLFRDDVELLACLAADWSLPGGRSNWWWRRVVPAGSSGVVAAAWLAASPAVPAVVDRLARRGELVRALSAMDDGDVEAIVDALAVTYDVRLPGGWRAMARAADVGRPPGTRRPAPVPGRRARTDASPPHADGQAADAPWIGLRSELRGLDRRRTLLAGIALTLFRRPGAATSSAFAAAIGSWLRGEVIAPPPRQAATSGQRVARGTTGGRVRKRPGKQRSTIPGSHGSQPSGRPRPTPLRPESSRSAAAVTAAPAPAAPVAGPPTVVPGQPAVAEIELPPVPTGLTVRTQLGGVFFLLDLALYLGIYGDFTRPGEPGIELDAWDFLTLLASELGLREELQADPLGDLLRHLAGRSRRQRPGSGWHPDRDWRMPPAWLVPFESVTGPWRWSGGRGRLRVEHPAGFVVLDVARGPRLTQSAVRRAIPRSSPSRVLRRATLPTLRTAGRREVDRWIARVGAYARARLALALGLDGRPDLANLLRLPAVVAVGPLDVDVEFELAALPIAVRIAGLDRDPGWIPAARRTVRFHFR